MPLYFSAHTTACLTKQALRALMEQLLASTEVKVRRCVASQLGGRMITEVEAPERAMLEKWFETHYINCEWIMPIDLDARRESGVVSL
jgi:hypothetical protein